MVFGRCSVNVDGMSALSDLALFIGYTERVAPKAVKSRKWREHRDKALESVCRAASKAELWQNLGACEGSLEDELCQEETITIEEMARSLEKHFIKPESSGSTNGKEKPSNVRQLR